MRNRRGPAGEGRSLEQYVNDRPYVASSFLSVAIAELVKRVQAGDEVLLTQGNKLVAKLISALKDTAPPHGALRVRSLTGHKVLTPVVAQADLADDFFGR